MKNYGIDRDNATILAMLRWPIQPSLAEISRFLKFSKTQARDRVEWLEQAGYLVKETRRSRSLVLTEKGRDVYPEFVVIRRGGDGLETENADKQG